MKELTIEQKVKRYDEISKDVKDFFDGKLMMYSDVKQTLNYLFPELKESEDEKIRKVLLDSFEYRIKESYQDKEWICGVKLKEILAWLEKQKSVGEIVDRCKNSWYNEGKIAGQFEGITDDEKYQQGWHDALEKQGEQKLSDKVEPKFHEGDWVVYKNDICQIVKREEGCNKLVTVFGIEKEFVNERNLSTARLWTIQDAKGGDVLYSLDSKQPFIFKHRKPNEQAAVYCGINTYGKFFIGNTKDCVITTDKYIPADKFQRDLLFKKIEEAGYQWDAKNKELKLLISNGGDFESNNSKQKPTWSDEDEEILKNLIDYFSLDDGLRLPTEETIDWLKSLKERLS